ncbi:MAG: alpha/beta fold hydrolase [Streptosporangiaceae bacterium]
MIVDSLEEEADRLVTTVDGVRVTWRRWGTGPPVVMLHGGWGSWLHWVRNVAALRRRFTVLAADLPGFGDSPCPPELTSAEGMADATSASLDQVLPHPTRVALVGFSFGGIIAGLVAARQGSRVRSLALIGAGGLGVGSTEPLPLRRLREDMSQAERAAAYRHNVGTVLIACPDEIDDVATWVYAENVRRTRFMIRGIPTSDVLARALSHVSARLVAIYGERDVFARDGLPVRQEILRTAHPEVRFVVVEGAGHWVNYEASGQVNDLLLAHL